MTNPTIKLDIIAPAMEVHQYGCADVKRTMKQGRSRATRSEAANVTTYEGETIIAAIVAADTDLADWFGQEAYVPSGDQPWTVATCHIAPCAKALMTGLVYDGSAAPTVADGYEIGPKERTAHRVAKQLAPKPATSAGSCKGKWSTCGGRNAALPKKGWNLCQKCTDVRAASRREAAAPVPQIRVETHQYVVEYVTADEAFHRVTVEALDATDAKHLAEALEGGVVVKANAKRVRKGATK